MMGNLPGATWHHRSFAETAYCKAVALVLDWCGQLLTPFGKQVLMDALVMKGLPRIESDFKRAEYIRYMNQGIIFSYGRIFALIALLKRYPRYLVNLQEVEQDLISMVNNYVQQDGGTLEGPGYWMLTFNDVMPMVYALAQQKGVEFTYYKDIFEKTGDFALSMLSLAAEETELLPINNSHPNVHMSCALAACFYEFTQNPKWKNLYETLMNKGYVDDDNFALICSPMPEGNTSTSQENTMGCFLATGQCGIKQSGAEIVSHLHLCSGPTYPAHFHQDKGSIILEANGKTICPDLGGANYSDSDLFYLPLCYAHSLLNPVFEDGTPSKQGAEQTGGEIIKAEQNEQGFEIASDDTNAWSQSPYQSIQRRILSPCEQLYLIEDTVVLDKASHAQWLLNCYGEFAIEGNQATATVGEVQLRVVPLNWSWEKVSVNTMQDGNRQPVWQLQADTPSTKSQVLLTALCLEKTQAIKINPIHPEEWQLQQGNKNWILQKDQTTNGYTIKAKQ